MGVTAVDGVTVEIKTHSNVRSEIHSAPIEALTVEKIFGKLAVLVCIPIGISTITQA